MRSHLSLLSLFALAACTGGPISKDKLPPPDTDTEEGSPNLLLSTYTIDFGGVYLGESADQLITIQNNGAATLAVTGVAADAPFTTSFGSLLEVAPGSSTSLTIRYKPTGYTVDSGEIVLTSNDPDEPSAIILVEGAVITDGDGDGFKSEDAGGFDCDDDDASIYPDAPDTWYDGIDSDCAEDDDYDQDRDGYQAAVYNADPGRGGGDCQDVNSSIYPGAPDTWYDGVDSDCAGDSDFDQDGDGDGAEAYGRGGTDCDDTNPAVNADAIESLNGLDDDCNDEVDLDIPAWNANITIYGNATGDTFGEGVLIYDLDGDGFDDVLVGATVSTASGTRSTGAVDVFLGDSLPADGSSASDASAFISGAATNDRFGAEVVLLGDYTGDGVKDVAVGSPSASSSHGRVDVFSVTEATTTAAVTAISDLTITGTTAYYVGEGLATGLDLDGDGQGDLAGTYVTSTSTSSAPYLWLNYAGSVGSIGLDAADAFFSTDGKESALRENFPTVGDLNGDGLTDLIYCDNRSTAGGTTSGGTVWVLWGQSTQYSNTAAASLSTEGSLAVVGDNFEEVGANCSAGPDLDGDGTNELWVYTASSDAKGVYLFFGGDELQAGSLGLDDSPLLYSFRSSAPDVLSMRTAADLDNDGLPDLVAALTGESSAVPGRAWIWPSSVTSGGDDAEDAALATIEGDSDYNQEEFAARLPLWQGDINGDGVVDWLATDAEYYASKGSLYLTFGVAH